MFAGAIAWHLGIIYIYISSKRESLIKGMANWY